MKKIRFILFILISFSILHIVNAQNSEIDSLENLLQKHLKRDTIRVNLLNETAYRLHTVDINKTLTYAEKARELSDKLNFKKGNAESLRIIGIYYSLKTKYSEALEYFQKSLVIAQEIKDKKGISNCLINIGNIHRNHSNYLLALEYFQKSLVIAEESKDKNGISNCLIHIGIIFYEMQDYDKALEYYQKSSKIYEELGEKIGITYTLNNIALVYEKQYKLEKALDYYGRCITIAKEINFTHILGWAYNGKGIVLMKQQKHEEALEYFLKGLKKRESINENKEIAQSCNSIGKLYIETKEYKKAIKYLSRGYEIANEINNYLNLNDAAKEMSFVYEQTGNYKKSLEYHKIYKQYSDSLINQENITNLTGFEIRTQYEKEKQAIILEQQKKEALVAEKAKRQKKINIGFIIGFIVMTSLTLVALINIIQKRRANRILIKQKNQIIEKNIELQNLNEEIQTQSEELKDKNDRLLELNATRNKLFSIIAHDLKSPFNSLLGISEQLVENYAKYNNEERSTYLKFINDGAQKTYKLLENLLTWAQSQTGKIKFTPEKINIEKLMNEIVLLLKESARNKKIKIISNIENNLSMYADKNMIETVIRNLVSNAIKFTPKGGQIKVTGAKNKEIIKVSVKDSGVGISPDVQSKIFNISENFSTKGTENEKGTGLGLIVCKEFVEKHGGKIWVESEAEKGSEFLFTIPQSFENNSNKK